LKGQNDTENTLKTQGKCFERTQFLSPPIFIQ